MAVNALTVLGALQSGVVALAVFLAAEGFLARAFTCRNIRSNSLEVTRLTIVNDTFGLHDFLLVPWSVMAADA